MAPRKGTTKEIKIEKPILILKDNVSIQDEVEEFEAEESKKNNIVCFIRDIFINQKDVQLTVLILKIQNTWRTPKGVALRSALVVDANGDRAQLVAFSKKTELLNGVKKGQYYGINNPLINPLKGSQCFPNQVISLVFGDATTIDLIEEHNYAFKVDYVFDDEFVLDTVVDIEAEIIAQKGERSFTIIMNKEQFTLTDFEGLELKPGKSYFLGGVLYTSFSEKPLFKTTVGSIAEVSRFGTLQQLQLMSLKDFAKSEVQIANCKIKIERLNTQGFDSPTKKLKIDSYNLSYVVSQYQDETIRVEIRIRELASKLLNMTPNDFYGMSQNLKDKAASSILGKIGNGTLMRSRSGPFETFVLLNFEE